MDFNFHLYVHLVGDPTLASQLAALIQLGEKIMATQEEAAAQLTAVNEELAKVGNETRSLLTKVDDLTAAVVAAGSVGPALQAAIDAVAAQVKVVDDMVPDAPVA